MAIGRTNEKVLSKKAEAADCEAWAGDCTAGSIREGCALSGDKD